MTVPHHVAIIMDGNGRWAQKRSLSRLAGHEKGVEVVRDVVDACCERGIRYLTLYAFSSENWGRPQSEVNALMELLVQFLREELPRMHQHRIRLHIIGDVDQLPLKARRVLSDCLTATEGYDRLVLTLALSYGSRNEMVRCVQKIVQQRLTEDKDFPPVTEEDISTHLDTGDIPDPDLIIRTSGEQRLSNFMLWQSAYAELVFLDVLWPDFNRTDLDIALQEYGCRDRRYGLAKEEDH